MQSNTTPLPDAAPPTTHLDEAARQRAELLARLARREPEVRVSKYAGTCPSCRLPIEAGHDQITNALGTWAHLACAVCVMCGTWITTADSALIADGLGRAHHACASTAPTA